MTDFDIDAVGDGWEALADAGRAVMQHMDTGRWLAGDLAGQIVDTHGEKEYNTCIRNAPAQLRTAGGVSQMRRHHD